MKSIILNLLMFAILSACGKKDNTETQTEVKANESISASEIAVDTFIGVYDLTRMDSEDCGASIRIVKVCDGLQLRSNNLVNQSFCNINRGEIKTGDKRSSTTVTLEKNILKSITLVFDERSTPPGNVRSIVTNTLKLESDGSLLKLADLKTGKSSCLYQKR